MSNFHSYVLLLVACDIFSSQQHDTNKTGSIEFASFRAILGDLGKHYSAEEAIAIGKKISYQADCVSFFQMLVHYKALKGNNGTSEQFW